MTAPTNPLKFNIAPAQRLILFALTYLVGLVATAFIATFLMKIAGDSRYVAMLRVSTMIQDVVMLVLPAVATAVIVTSQPARLLCLQTKPRGSMIVFAMLVVVVSAPAMSYIIRLNESLTLPESMASLERALREAEAGAAQSIAAMMVVHNIPNLLVNILIIGVMAGFSEELFFRGGLQRLLQSTRLSPVAAIWITTMIFSAVHMQFYGFIPRMLLGAYFGYLLLWTGSIWVPMAAHMFNNTMFVVLQYVTGTGDPQIAMPGMPQWIVPAVSLVATVVLLSMRRRLFYPASAKE